MNVIYINREGALKMFPKQDEPAPEESKRDPWDFHGDDQFQLAQHLHRTLVEEENQPDTLWQFGWVTLNILLARWAVIARDWNLFPDPVTEQEYVWRKTRRQPSRLAWAIRQAVEVTDHRKAQDIADALWLRHAFQCYTVLDAL